MDNERLCRVQADAMVHDRAHDRLLHLSCELSLSLSLSLSQSIGATAILLLLLPELVGDALNAVEEIAVLRANDLIGARSE